MSSLSILNNKSKDSSKFKSILRTRTFFNKSNKIKIISKDKFQNRIGYFKKPEVKDSFIINGIYLQKMIVLTEFSSFLNDCSFYIGNDERFEIKRILRIKYEPCFCVVILRKKFKSEEDESNLNLNEYFYEYKQYFQGYLLSNSYINPNNTEILSQNSRNNVILNSTKVGIYLNSDFDEIKIDFSSSTQTQPSSFICIKISSELYGYIGYMTNSQYNDRLLLFNTCIIEEVNEIINKETYSFDCLFDFRYLKSNRQRFNLRKVQNLVVSEEGEVKSLVESCLFIRNDKKYKSGICVKQVKKLFFYKSFLVILDIKDCKIGNKGMILLSRTDFPNLKILDLSKNSLTKKDLKYIYNLNSPLLTSLNMDNNQLRTLTLKHQRHSKHIKQVLTNYPCLKRLSCECNSISINTLLLDDSINSLEYINLSNNRILYITSQSFSSSIKYLDLSNNLLNENSIFLLSECSFPHLTYLNLTNNRFYYKGTVYFPNFHFPSLEYFYLTANKIGDFGLKNLIFTYFPRLKLLDVSYCYISDLGLFYLSKIYLPRLSFLNVNNNRITGGGLKFLSFFTRMFKLTFNGNYLDTNNMSMNIENLFHFTSLMSLDLSNSNMNDAAVEVMCKLPYMNIKTLNLNSSLVGNQTIELLSYSNFPLLEKIFISNNLIDNRGILYISKWNFLKLKILELNNLLINEEGLKCISQCNFPLLSELFLSDNRIHDNGVSYLSKSNFYQLKIVDFSKNLLSFQCMTYFLQCNFMNVVKIDIENNLLSKEELVIVYYRLKNRFSNMKLNDLV